VVSDSAPLPQPNAEDPTARASSEVPCNPELAALGSPVDPKNPHDIARRLERLEAMFLALEFES